MRRILACIFLFVAPLLAQSRLESGEPAATATGPSFEASLGYVYFDMAMPSQRVALTGADASGLVKFNSHWGATIDSTYASAGNVLGTGHGANVLSFLAGPVFDVPGLAKAGVFVHALAGACRVDGAVPANGGYYLDGWVARPSYAFGGGVEHPIFGSFGFRVQGDYQRTTFADSTGAIQGQNNLRLTTSLVYGFGGGFGKRD
jgi:hypothetical protein